MIESTIIGDRAIVIKGIGKMLYQEGLPLGISAIECNKQGYEVSWLHIADELLKEGWIQQAVLSRIKEEMEDDNQGVDIEKIKDFIYAEYEEQREMIFDYLFKSIDEAKAWGVNYIQCVNVI